MRNAPIPILMKPSCRARFLAALFASTSLACGTDTSGSDTRESAVATLSSGALYAESPEEQRSNARVFISDEEKKRVRAQGQAILERHAARGTTSVSQYARVGAVERERGSSWSVPYDCPPFQFGNGQFDRDSLDLTGSWFVDDQHGSRIGTKKTFYNDSAVMAFVAKLRPAGNYGKMTFFALREPWAASCSDPRSCKSDEVDWEFPGKRMLETNTIDAVVFSASGRREFYAPTVVANDPASADAEYWIFLQSGRYLAFKQTVDGEAHMTEYWADQYYVPQFPMSVYVGVWDCSQLDICGKAVDDNTWMSISSLGVYNCGGQ